jgi:catechol 2,3-dioxygenase-like lactoylglutathione lyase family enzyme/DNA-binding CsgD family transcriptional regulator
MVHRGGRGRPRHPDVLTPAEWAVLDLVRHGLSRREIARHRGTSLDAVKYHLDNIGGKLGVAGVARLRHWPGFPATSRLNRTQEEPMNQTMEAVQLGPLGQVSLYARDVARAETFYRDVLGLPHVFTFGDLAFFDCGGVRLYIHAVGEEEWRPGSILYFLVDDIRTAHEDLGRRGVKFTGAPHLIYEDDETHVQEWMAFFEDNEGNTLALMSRVQPAD